MMGIRGFVGPRCAFVLCLCVYSRVGASCVGRPICVCAVLAPLRRVIKHTTWVRAASASTGLRSSARLRHRLWAPGRLAALPAFGHAALESRSRAQPTLVSSSPAARFELPGVARSGVLCILPAPTHADTCLRLRAGTEAMLIVRPKAFGFDGAISSGTSVSGSLAPSSLAPSSPAPSSSAPSPPRCPASARVQIERPPPSTAGHLTAAEHSVADRLVYPKAICPRGSLH